MITIDDSMIVEVERLLLPPGESFNNERRAVIRCLESKDIQACPGSGKTTTLLAKLSILTKQLPLGTNQGVCVLTHTNVAVEEIRSRLQGRAEILFQYPNHFGTIQSFVNRFLAIPVYINLFGKRPARIDDEFYEEYVQRRYRSLKQGAKYWLDQRRISLLSLRFNNHDFSVSKALDGNAIMSPTSKSYQEILDFKMKILAEGVLCYDDAYALAYAYLRKYPGIKEILTERFVYVFMDEMQDTDCNQNDILAKCFNPTRTVVQKMGDVNQSIFNSRIDEGWKLSKEYLTISDSKRFSRAIAERVKYICREPQDLVGNENIPSIAPKIIIYNDDSILKVMPKFSEIIIENGLHTTGKGIFKAIGWVGQPKDKRTIPSYFPQYGLPDINKKIDYECLADYLKMAATSSGDSLKQSLSILYKAILKSLRLARITRENNMPFTEKSLIHCLKTQHIALFDLLNNCFVRWCLQINRGEDITDELKEVIRQITIQLEGSTNDELNSFLDSPSVIQPSNESTKTNIYEYENEDNQISIQLSSVHSVKGETHTATLYLETFYYQYDVESLMGYLKGNHTIPRGARISAALKMAYVGMTRPSHLLCIAAHQDGCEAHIEQLKASGWDIVRV